MVPNDLAPVCLLANMLFGHPAPPAIARGRVVRRCRIHQNGLISISLDGLDAGAQTEVCYRRKMGHFVHRLRLSQLISQGPRSPVSRICLATAGYSGST